MSLIADADLHALLDALHARSEGQEGAIGAYLARRAAADELDWKGLDEGAHRFMADKLVALDRDKAEFCYGLCRAMNARRIVEIGTSFGVSTLYLAAAARDNAAAGGQGPAPLVIGTEHEPDKAAAARANFRAAGLDGLIDLRVGDLRETLKSLAGPIDFVLMDIWTEMARPALELVSPHLRDGAVIIADNTLDYREPYGAYFAFIADPANRLRTMTLPFQGGLEMTVRCG
ncbi:O-methyltransferase [Caulobacter sp. KR2-114]|uniref:O-methyltransferase n=1 Tax=Caulobacter sp. KR2-114 TaxID=3400912 RepID=UPI003C095788